MSQRYQVYSNLMFAHSERSYSEETVLSRSACSQLSCSMRDPSSLSGLLATEVLTVNENEALHYRSLHPLPTYKICQRLLSDKRKCLRLFNGQSPLCEAREQQHGEQRGGGKLLEAPESSVAAGTLKATAANEGTRNGGTGRYHTVVVWSCTCGEDLGMWRCEIRKKCRVTGDTAEQRIQIQQQQGFTSCATHGMVEFGLLFLDITHFFLEFSVLKWHCLKI